MKNIDRIRKYIVSRREQGILMPGDKLPSYKAMMEMFDISYLTVSSIINKLAEEGLVETRRGQGSYIAGSGRLKVLINIHPTTISFADMRKLLNKYLVNASLHLDFDIQAVEDLGNRQNQRRCMHDYKAALSVYSAFLKEDNLPPAQLTQFPDYENVIRGLTTVEGLNYEDCLPYTFTTHQIGVNRRLLERTGFRLSDLTGDFEWWNEFTAKCRSLGIEPASMDYRESESFLFQDFLPVLLMLCPFCGETYEGDAPLFHTPGGFRFLEILRDTVLIRDRVNDPRSFFHNGAVLNFKVGSWLTAQNGLPERPDKRVDSLEYLPYRDRTGARFHLLSESVLKAYLRHDIAAEERNRVWNLMKIMVSREFQTEFCSLTGQISANRDILPTEHFWNRHNENGEFFPQKGELKIFEKQIFTEWQRVMLSMLLEDHKFFHLDAQTILERMDLKKRHFRLS